MIGVAAVPAFLQGVFMLYMPETQRWLAKKGKAKKMQEVLERVYNYESIQVQREVLEDEIRNTGEEKSEIERVKEVFGSYRKCVVIACSL